MKLNIKNHRIIISIIVIIIAVIIISSSLYLYQNKTERYNDVHSYTMKYSHNLNVPENNISISSYSTHGNKINYLNTTMDNITICACPGLTIGFTLNIKENYNKNVKIYYSSKYYNIPFKCNEYKYNFIKEPIMKNNKGYYNFTLKVSSGNLYNVFKIDTYDSSALYGSVGTSYSTADRNTSLDSTLYIKDLNNGTIYKTPIVKGQYLFFAKPNTNYELMYLKNNQLIPFESKNSSGPYNLTNIESPNAGNSSHIDMFYR